MAQASTTRGSRMPRRHDLLANHRFAGHRLTQRMQQICAQAGGVYGLARAAWAIIGPTFTWINLARRNTKFPIVFDRSTSEVFRRSSRPRRPGAR
jgi:hypothetical protein